jgi:Asp-tRNA(Asn)/Glu-tRNA(Gln) amidotransferase A subunit family amidase
VGIQLLGTAGEDAELLAVAASVAEVIGPARWPEGSSGGR